MCSLVIYGLLAYSICFLPTSHRLRLSFGFLTILLVFAIGVSRLYLGVHYFSDVMAGYLAATFWLILCITGDQAARCLRTLWEKRNKPERELKSALRTRLARETDANGASTGRTIMFGGVDGAGADLLAEETSPAPVDL